jgi:hypothetical protein
MTEDSEPLDGSAKEGSSSRKDLAEASGASETGRSREAEHAEEIAEFVKDMPMPARRSLEIMLMSGSNQGAVNPLVDKFNDEHIDKILDYAQQDETNKYHFESSNRWFRLGCFFLALAVLLAILILFKDDQAMLQQILEVLVVFVGGFGSGYGFKVWKERDRS